MKTRMTENSRPPHSPVSHLSMVEHSLLTASCRRHAGYSVAIRDVSAVKLRRARACFRYCDNSSNLVLKRLGQRTFALGTLCARSPTAPCWCKRETVLVRPFRNTFHLFPPSGRVGNSKEITHLSADMCLACWYRVLDHGQHSRTASALVNFFSYTHDVLFPFMGT